MELHIHTETIRDLDSAHLFGGPFQVGAAISIVTPSGMRSSGHVAKVEGDLGVIEIDGVRWFLRRSATIVPAVVQASLQPETWIFGGRNR
jgi:hypothetical protein